MRKWFFISVILLFLLGLIFLFWVWQNNKESDHPQQKELEKSLASGINWLESHRTEILEDANPMLWWMVKRSAELTGSKGLNRLYADYHARYFLNTNSVWLPLFDAKISVPLQMWQFEDLPYYNLLFLYGISCSPELGKVKIVQEQQEVSFCNSNPLSPTCVTHQMMGLMLMRDRGCGEQNEIGSTISKLQDRLVLQMMWDVRVVDVYIQRVLMLVDSGAPERVKPIWIRRILQAQSEEGGWTGFQPIMPVGQGLALGFSARGVDIGTNQANFHATAQGVLLMSLMLRKT